MVLAMQLSLKAVGLSKSYDKKKALIDLNLKIRAGSIYGLIGPNGAGKTTALAMLAGYIQPSSGAAWALGQPILPGSPEVSARVGFSSPQFPFPDYLTAIEILSTCGRMHRLELKEVGKRVADLLALMDLQSAGSQYICHYSQGMRQKLSLACAFIHTPPICILDEPFLGLDSTSAYRVIRLLIQLAAKGRTILVSSHDMALMERLCNRVGILHEGVLQKEIVLAPAADSILTDIPKYRSLSVLESALWGIAGTPTFKEFSWI